MARIRPASGVKGNNRYQQPALWSAFAGQLLLPVVVDYSKGGWGRPDTRAALRHFFGVHGCPGNWPAYGSFVCLASQEGLHQHQARLCGSVFGAAGLVLVPAYRGWALGSLAVPCPGRAKHSPGSVGPGLRNRATLPLRSGRSAWPVARHCGPVFGVAGHKPRSTPCTPLPLMRHCSGLPGPGVVVRAANFCPLRFGVGPAGHGAGRRSLAGLRGSRCCAAWCRCWWGGGCPSCCSHGPLPKYHRR